MKLKSYQLIDDGDSFIVKELEEKDFKNKIPDGKIFYSISELFVYLFDNNNSLSFFDIFKVLALNNIEFNKCELIRHYISNSQDIKETDEEIYIKIKINKGSIYEILSILPKTISNNKIVKGASLTLKIQKHFIPLYLAIFIKDYGIEDYYMTIKEILGDSKKIPFFDLYNHNQEYYVVKNRDKIIYISTTKRVADYYVELIGSIRKDASQYFVPNIEIICGFKNLINYLKIQNPNMSPNNFKNIVDFDKIHGVGSEDDLESHSLINSQGANYVIRTKDDDYILKYNIEDAYNFIIENKIHAPELMEVVEMKRMVSKREVIKSVLLSNIIDNDEDIDKLNGISILENDNLIKIYSNIINILLKKRNSSPFIAIVLKNNFLKYDILFFFDEERLNLYKECNKKEVRFISVNEISLESTKNKLIEKNLEIIMNEESNFSSLDVAINLTPLYKNDSKCNSPKIKRLKDIPCIIDVDSSLDEGIASCGIVLRDSSDKILGKISRGLDANTSVEAEIRGAMHAIKYAIMEDFTEVCLRYDYVGIFEYLISNPATDIAKEYQDFFNKIVNNNNIEIYFKKVKAHSLDEYNELADYLAGNLNVNESFSKINQ